MLLFRIVLYLGLAFFGMLVLYGIFICWILARLLLMPTQDHERSAKKFVKPAAMLYLFLAASIVMGLLFGRLARYYAHEGRSRQASPIEQKMT
jgi:prolipoprotein diacylglyceryltransferase